MLRILELVGIATFAASGALVGVTKRLDVFGVCVMGVFTALGGGIVRDVLIGVHPPTSLVSPANLGTAFGVSFVVMFLHSVVTKMRRQILVLDALGMGLFASTGAVVALDHGAGALAASLVGATTAIGGGVLRDILVNEVPLLLQREFYAVPALIAAALVGVVVDLGLPTDIGLVVGTAFAFVLRVVSLWRGWGLPTARVHE
nr:trimeric intracellular cation channel family protein [Rhodococcus sp. HNM0569]